MKKRILSLAMVLALVAVMAMPMAALAVSQPAVIVVPATAGVVNADYTIFFNVANGLKATDTVTIIFPAGTGVATSLTGTINTNPIETAVVTGTTSTITVPNGFGLIQSAGLVTVVLTTGITNPPAGTKLIWVATSLASGVALEGGVESAPYTITGGTTTTTVSATMPSGVLTLTVPGAVTLANLHGSSSVDEAGTSSGTVLSTLADGYTLYLQSNQAEGKLMLGGSGATLNQPLKIRPTSPGTVLLDTGTGAEVVVGSAWVLDAAATTTPTIAGATAVGGSDDTGTNTITLNVAQPKQATGTPGTYSYILTWTLSAN